MSMLEHVIAQARARSLPFVVIGGHAVAAHGYGRQTLDLDLLVRDEDRPAWLELLLALGYRVFHEDPAFVQLAAPTAAHWPVDLLLVDEPTFAGVVAEARDVDLGAERVPIPSLEHLLALKLHALRGARPPRDLKDLTDVVQLVQANGLDVRGEPFRALCLKYATPEIHDRIVRAFGD
jgi:hypothetical protein